MFEDSVANGWFLNLQVGNDKKLVKFWIAMEVKELKGILVGFGSDIGILPYSQYKSQLEKNISNLKDKTFPSIKFFDNYLINKGELTMPVFNDGGIYVGRSTFAIADVSRPIMGQKMLQTLSICVNDCIYLKKNSSNSDDLLDEIPIKASAQLMCSLVYPQSAVCKEMNGSDDLYRSVQEINDELTMLEHDFYNEVIDKYEKKRIRDYSDMKSGRYKAPKHHFPNVPCLHHFAGESGEKSTINFHSLRKEANSDDDDDPNVWFEVSLQFLDIKIGNSVEKFVISLCHEVDHSVLPVHLLNSSQRKTLGKSNRKYVDFQTVKLKIHGTIDFKVCHPKGKRMCYYKFLVADVKYCIFGKHLLWYLGGNLDQKVTKYTCKNRVFPVYFEQVNYPLYTASAELRPRENVSGIRVPEFYIKREYLSCEAFDKPGLVIDFSVDPPCTKRLENFDMSYCRKGEDDKETFQERDMTGKLVTGEEDKRRQLVVKSFFMSLKLDKRETQFMLLGGAKTSVLPLSLFISDDRYIPTVKSDSLEIHCHSIKRYGNASYEIYTLDGDHLCSHNFAIADVKYPILALDILKKLKMSMKLYERLTITEQDGKTVTIPINHLYHTLPIYLESDIIEILQCRTRGHVRLVSRDIPAEKIIQGSFISSGKKKKKKIET